LQAKSPQFKPQFYQKKKKNPKPKKKKTTFVFISKNGYNTTYFTSFLFCFVCLGFLVVLGFEFKVSHLLGKRALPLELLCIFKIASIKLLAQADLLISASPVARITGVSHQHMATVQDFLES
jgi:hypothetical protein